MYSFLGCSSVVHLSVISWQKSTVTVWLLGSRGGPLSEKVPGSVPSSLRAEVQFSEALLGAQGGPGGAAPCSKQQGTVSPAAHGGAARFCSTPKGAGLILEAVGRPMGLRTGQYRCRAWTCSGLWMSRQTSWERQEKLSSSSPMHAFSWFLSDSSFSFSHTWTPGKQETPVKPAPDPRPCCWAFQDPETQNIYIQEAWTCTPARSPVCAAHPDGHRS